MGEPAGIGPEVIVKALCDPVLRHKAHFIIYGMNELLHYAADIAEFDVFWWRDQYNGRLRNYPHDVVVVDYRMPRMNGVEMIARVRAKDATARIILLSSVVEPLGLTEENTGADVVIAKNAAEPTHLARSIKRLLNRAPLRKPPGRQKGGAPRARAMAR